MALFQESYMLAANSKYRGFIVTKSVAIPELDCHLTELTHEQSGAEVLHIHANDPENFFCLSFQTLPSSSNGVAHILEHTVLTGSEKFPVKDPFFSMSRRSINTFMNALTGADFTCYPASSQVEQDFYNLLTVYLDAVFHPQLKKLSFAQEGHRLEFATATDPTTPLEYKGIVYNEMKGSLSSPTSRLNEALSSALFPNTPYGHNSGGDPKEIPKLTYEELISFHKTYYHPSRCLFFFYGNLPLEKHLDFIEDKELCNVKKEPKLPPITLQPRFSKEVRKELYYPAADDEENDEKTLISLGWLTAPILQELDVLALTVLDSVLMDTDASLLKRACLQSGLCKQASSSLDTESAEVPFIITMKGCKKQDADAIEELIRETLTRIAKEGIPEKLIESALHQLELDRIEICPDGGPFGLTLFGRAALIKQHGGSAEDGLRIHSLFKDLRDILSESPQFLSELIVKYLLNNKHFVRITMEPSQELAKKEAEEERAELDTIQNTLTEQQKQEIIALAEKLKAFQEEDDSDQIELLPKISLTDVPKKSRAFELTKTRQKNCNIYHHATFTNHIVYTDIVFPLAALKEEELWTARLLTQLAAQVGSGDRNFIENLNYIEAHTGGIGAHFSFNHQVYDSTKYTPTLHVRGKSLFHKTDKLFKLLFDTIYAPNFTDRDRIKELIMKYCTNLESTLTQSALRYAVNLSSSHSNQANHVANEWYGLEYFFKVRHLAHHFDTEGDAFIEELQRLQEKLFCTEGADLVITCDETEYTKLVERDFDGLVDLPAKPFTSWKNEFTLPKIAPQARIIPSSVAFTAKSFTSLSYAHPDAAFVALAANIFDNTVLHKRIREQGGAYGGGTSYNPTSGNFYFYSFRDPHIAKTVKAFEEAIQETLTGNFDESNIDEAKLEMIQVLDAPVSPGARGDLAYSRLREGKTEEVRQAFRDRLLSATSDDIKRAVEKYIIPFYRESILVTFADRELIEKENKKLHPPLRIEKV